MKLFTLATIAVLAFLAYSVAQYCEESATLHEQAVATDRVPHFFQTSKSRKPIDNACLSSELAMRKRIAEQSQAPSTNVPLTAAIR